MEQQNNNVEIQIGRIVANAILKGQTIYLPELGSLGLKTLSSKINGRHITPPRYTVAYESQEAGISIIDIIMHLSQKEREAAEGVYSAWLTKARREAGTEIMGVGVIANNKFSTSTQFDGLLNPEAYRSLELKRRRTGWAWAVASILVCVIVGVAVNFVTGWYLSSSSAEPQTQMEVVAEVVETPQPTFEPVIEPVAEPVVEQVPASKARYRVVYGVFSTMENAQRGVALAQKAKAGVSAEVNPFGKMFMVSVFSSNDIAECRAFVEQSKEEYAELWINKRRGE